MSTVMNKSLAIAGILSGPNGAVMDKAMSSWIKKS